MKLQERVARLEQLVTFILDRLACSCHTLMAFYDLEGNRLHEPLCNITQAKKFMEEWS